MNIINNVRSIHGTCWDLAKLFHISDVTYMSLYDYPIFFIYPWVQGRVTNSAGQNRDFRDVSF